MIHGTWHGPYSRYVIHGETVAISPDKKGTKMAAHYVLEVEGGKEVAIKLRLTNNAAFTDKISPFGRDFDLIFKDRVREANEFYDGLLHKNLSQQEILVSKQAYAGMWGVDVSWKHLKCKATMQIPNECQLLWGNNHNLPLKNQPYTTPTLNWLV